MKLETILKLRDDHQKLIEYAEYHGADHDVGCPEDDTCSCQYKDRNDAVSRVCEYLHRLIDYSLELTRGAFIRSRSELTGRLPKAYSDNELLAMFGPWWTKGDTTGLNPREVRLLETVADRNLQISEGRKLTCVYCGHEYPFDETSAEQLGAHIHACPKHPLPKALELARQWEERAKKAEAEAMFLRDMETDRQRRIREELEEEEASGDSQ